MAELTELQRIRLTSLLLTFIKYRDNADYIVEQDLTDSNVFYFAAQYSLYYSDFLMT